MDEIRKALENNEKIKFVYCGKEIEVSRGTTLSELQEMFGFDLDILDLFSAEWRNELA